MSPDQVRLAHLLNQAKDKVLYVSPPYQSGEARAAFLSGYHACLSDIAKGQLDVTDAAGKGRP